MSDFPGLGDPFPDIAMETPEGGSVKPSDFAGRKLVVFFYPKDNTPGCTTENQDFSALKGEFDKAGVALLGVSKDSPRKHQGFIAKYDLQAPLASRITAAPTWAWCARPTSSARTAGSPASGTR